MVEQRKMANDSPWRWLPFAFCGFTSPIVGNLLSRWLPLYIAEAAAMFVMWILTGLVMRHMVASSNRGIMPWVWSGAAAGVIVGALAFLFPWR